MAHSTGDVLDTRSLNRATLARQLLLERSTTPTLDAVEHLVGMQAQNPRTPYTGLWSRLDGFHPEHLADLLRDRTLVRATCQRATIHLLSARDYRFLRPTLHPAIERDVYPNQTYGRDKLDGIDMDVLLTTGHALLSENPHTNTELRNKLAPQWPDRDPAALAYAVRALLPLVHVTPRGLWNTSGPIALATFASWTGHDIDDQPDPSQLVLRYLAAFGPASLQDIHTWSGLTRLHDVVDTLRPRLRTFRTDTGRELLDLPDAPRPDPDTPAPVRFLPEFENLLLSHADRTRFITDHHRRRLTTNARLVGTVLVDGYVRAQWRLEHDKTRATLTIEEYERLTRRDHTAINDEAAHLLDFTAPELDHDVHITSTD